MGYINHIACFLIELFRLKRRVEGCRFGIAISVSQNVLRESKRAAGSKIDGSQLHTRYFATRYVRSPSWCFALSIFKPIFLPKEPLKNPRTE